MRGSAAVGWRIELDRFDGVTPLGLRPALADAGLDWFARRPCDVAVMTGAGRVPVRQSGGRGATVLLLHGAGGSKEVFRRQFDGGLAQTYRLVAADLPATVLEDDDRSALDGAAVASEVLDQLDVAGAIVAVGWGRGAAVALALAERRRVAGAVVTGAPVPGLAERVGRARGVGVPVAAIQGADDPTLHRTPSTDSLLWRGTSHVIPRAGHAPFLDSPDVFNHLLSLFAGEVTRRG